MRGLGGCARGLLPLRVCPSQRARLSTLLAAHALSRMSIRFPPSPGRMVFTWNFREWLRDLLAILRQGAGSCRTKTMPVPCGGERGQGGLVLAGPAGACC